MKKAGAVHQWSMGITITIEVLVGILGVQGLIVADHPVADCPESCHNGDKNEDKVYSLFPVQLHQARYWPA